MRRRKPIPITEQGQRGGERVTKVAWDTITALFFLRRRQGHEIRNQLMIACTSNGTEVYTTYSGMHVPVARSVTRVKSLFFFLYKNKYRSVCTVRAKPSYARKVPFVVETNANTLFIFPLMVHDRLVVSGL